MSEAGAVKAELALTLQAAGLDVLDYIPARLQPPIVIIRAAAPYLTIASIGHEFVINLELQAVAMTADNEQATDALDDLIEALILALPSDAGFKEVSQPYNLVANNAEYLAATIGIDLPLTIEGA
jgi:hypothetical protein